ncbi:DUF3482 domain-containing protein [Aeromicrobium wangtongii]|uniref:DUF3482 domain-containing protein n=1 Tax=Aeromicrobium wangtongii TaxID=2969247 RepID=A0ABY5M2E9_9ACTN|nr:DUF3482 domain-containing protein [Aeromicrobium wangtongii]MCD9198333.1 DUF3482 domain-containing protein [Aeromicrobium wangtongii]UUP12365.1 DUF3482 domain-containing protein [Aeromicrobium wangtongii]
MPIPLIAAALIAAGTLSGGGGVALGGKGAYDIKKAQNRLAAAKEHYEKRRAASEESLTSTNATLARLGRQQEQALNDVVLRMGQFLRRHERQVKESERLLVNGVDASLSQVPGLRGLDIDAIRWMSGVLTSSATGAGVGAGLTTAVGSFGAASTGAAIAGLSGAAAESATLAFLGGGSLASGGGGMALGATALNFVTIGPALLVGGMVIKGQGTKALTQARKLEAQVAVGIAELDLTETNLGAICARCKELSGLLARLSTRAVAAIDLLESEAFDPQQHADRFQQAMTLVMAVRDVAACPVLDSDGGVNGRTETFTVKYRTMAKEEQDDGAK